MNRSTFVLRLDQIRRRKFLLTRIGLSLLFITLCAAMWFSKKPLSPGAMLTFKVGAIVFFAALAFAFISTLQSMCRRLGMHCPQCGRNLSGIMSARVLDSGQCFQCGAPIID